MTKRRTRFRWATAPARNSPDTFSRRLYVLTLRVAGALVRQDETLLDDRERWADELTDEMHRIGGGFIVTDYDHETGGRPSSRAVQDTRYVTVTDLERKVLDAITHVAEGHISNAEHSEAMAERGARGGKVSRRGNTFTLADFAPYAHLSNKAAAAAMRCSPRTVASRRKLYNETVSESVQSKPSIPPGILDSSTWATEQQEATAAVATPLPVDTPPSSAVATPLPKDTPQDQLTVYYSHEDEPQLPEFLADYSYEWLITQPQRLRNSLRLAEMTDADMQLAQHWGREKSVNSRLMTPPDFSEWDELQAIIDGND